MQTPFYAKPTDQDAPAMSGVGKDKAARPAAFSFSCLVLDKFAAAAETLSTTPQNQSKRPSGPPSVAPPPTEDDSRQPPEEGTTAPVAAAVAAPTTTTAAPPGPTRGRATRSTVRRLGLRKVLRQQEVATVAETPAAEATVSAPAAAEVVPEPRDEPQPPLWETTTKAIQLEALRALQCCPPRAEDEMTIQTGGAETTVSMQAVFPDDLSDYEQGLAADARSVRSSATAKSTKVPRKDADAAASSTVQDVSPDDLKELVQAASSTVDSLERKLSACRWVSICLFLLLVVAAALLIVLGVGVFGGSITQEAEVNDSSLSPSMAPTQSLESTLDTLKNEYLPSDTLEALTDPSSPQSKAWAWLEWQAEQRLQKGSVSSKLQTNALLTRFALATFYHATLGSSWTTDTAWLSLENECQWYSGVPEPCPNGTFSVLSLPQNNVTGTIPREIELLSQLSRIDLSINPLVELPESFAGMKALERLDLQQLSLTEVPELPSKLGHLDLRSNSLTGVPLEIANMTSLLTLLLGINPFESQTVPSFLTNLVSLTYLSLEDCQLSGTVPSSLARLTNLEYLILEDNGFVGSIPSQFSQLSSLKLMTLHQNQLTGSVPQAVCWLKQNTSMFLSVDCDAVQCDCGCGCGL